MAKLDGWKRIGIIVSVVWILGAGLYTHENTMDSYASVGALSEQTCEQAHPNSNWDECSKMLTDEIALGSKMGWEAAAVVGLIPVPIGWGFVYLVLFLVGWVKRGFARPL